MLAEKFKLRCYQTRKITDIYIYGRYNTRSLLESLKNDGTCLSLSNLLNELFYFVHKD